MMENKKINSDMIVKKLMDIWKEDPINSFRTLLRKLDNDYEEFDNSTQKLINKTFTKSLKDDKVSLELKLKDEDDELQDLPTGKEKVKNESDYEHSDKEEKEETHISFTKDVLPYVIPLTCILTIKNSNMDFVKMLNDIKENPELLYTFDDQCLLWWNKKDLIDLIKDIVNKYFDKSSNTYNISVQFKMSLQSLIDNPKELLELISDCLKPKAIEKKTFGEVFTPMDFINDKMLKDIEEYWLKNKNENIWTNEKLTWYDPASGMGNYPIAIYYKLMEGLKTKIPNEEQRKKHIIEKQLYMGELNKKNCFVIKQIFNINNEYKLNLYEGNTLNIKINEVFGITEFDIIIGNPPYNEEFKGNNGYAPPLFNKFTEFYMKKCKILSFIIPSRWFVGGKGLDKFLLFMTNRNDIVYIKNYINSQDIFGSSVIIKGGVNYFLKDDDYNDKCLFNNSFIELKKYDIIVDNKYISIINKILEYNSITDIYHSKGYYGVSLTDNRLSSEKKDNYITCYVSQIKGFKNYIDKNTLDKNKLNNYKVITVTASTANNDCFGNMFIGNIDDIHSESYISFNVNSNLEAESLLSYLKTRFANFLLKLRKVTHNISSSTCKWIPLLPLNKEWNDEEVYKYFKLSEDEIKLIKETKISGYNDIKSINKNELNIIKDGKKQYYLINDKLYKIKKDKSQGDLFGRYIDGKIIEGIEEITNIKDKKSKSKNNEEVNIIENDEIITVSKKKTSKSNIIINDDTNETKEKKIRIKKSNNNKI
jgi:site-specific DNA-methyltransferase (adenine-specific)